MYVKLDQHFYVQWFRLPVDELTFIHETGYTQIIPQIETNVLFLYAF
jgi:hypothetical protein